MKINEIVLIVLCLAVSYLLIFKGDTSDSSGDSSAVTMTTRPLTAEELPDTEYRLDIPNSMHEVVIEGDPRDTQGNLPPRFKVVFKWSMVASSDMWIPDTVSLNSGVQTGVHVILYGPNGPLSQSDQSDVRMSIETGGAVQEQGFYLPAGTLVMCTVTVDQPFRVGLMGVRLHTGRVFCGDPRVPAGLEFPFVDAAFDTGLIEYRSENAPPVESPERGNKA